MRFIPKRVREEKEVFWVEQRRNLSFWSRYDFSMLYISHFELFYSISCRFWVHLGVWMWTFDIMHIFEILDWFSCIFVDSSLAPLASFVNNLCIPLFMNNLNMDSSLNVIFEDHVLAFFWFHLYLDHWHLWNGARFNRVISICIHFVSIFTFSSIFGIFGVLGITFELVVLIGMLLREFRWRRWWSLVSD